jgi:hypothetical protein
MKTHVACNKQMYGFLQNIKKCVHFKEPTRNCFYYETVTDDVDTSFRVRVTSFNSFRMNDSNL